MRLSKSKVELAFLQILSQVFIPAQGTSNGDPYIFCRTFSTDNLTNQAVITRVRDSLRGYS